MVRNVSKSKRSDSSMALIHVCCLQTSYSLCSSLPLVALHDGGLKDASDVFIMGNSRAIVMILKTLDAFSITLCHLCQPLNYVHGRSTFECIPQVRQLVNISQMWLIVNGGLELLPKRPPVQDSAIKLWDLNLHPSLAFRTLMEQALSLFVPSGMKWPL